MKLVLQPLADRNVPDGDQIIHIIREVYQRIYRIPDVENNPAFRRIIASIKC
jgi:hypothetical protein